MRTAVCPRPAAATGPAGQSTFHNPFDRGCVINLYEGVARPFYQLVTAAAAAAAPAERGRSEGGGSSGRRGRTGACAGRAARPHAPASGGGGERGGAERRSARHSRPYDTGGYGGGEEGTRDGTKCLSPVCWVMMCLSPVGWGTKKFLSAGERNASPVGAGAARCRCMSGYVHGGYGYVHA